MLTVVGGLAPGDDADQQQQQHSGGGLGAAVEHAQRQPGRAGVAADGSGAGRKRKAAGAADEGAEYEEAAELSADTTLRVRGAPVIGSTSMASRTKGLGRAGQVAELPRACGGARDLPQREAPATAALRDPIAPLTAPWHAAPRSPPAPQVPEAPVARRGGRAADVAAMQRKLRNKESARRSRDRKAEVQRQRLEALQHLQARAAAAEAAEAALRAQLAAALGLAERLARDRAALAGEVLRLGGEVAPEHGEEVEIPALEWAGGGGMAALEAPPTGSVGGGGGGSRGGALAVLHAPGGGDGFGPP
jgi:hypothetical protein